jgi:sulfatase modifying factor 1
MKTKIVTLSILIMILFISAKTEKKPIFTLDKFEASFSKISDKLYFSKHEVTNIQYITFLDELSKSNELEKYKISQIDTAQWITKEGYDNPYATLYHRHPAYSNYPVVNITYEGALLFCEWLTNKYNSYDKRKFKKVIFRLPTQTEWENAARGGLKENSYPWGGFYLEDYKGIKQCNYLVLGDQSISFNEEKEEFEIVNMGQTSHITMPVNSFKGNGFGLFNMSGNVAEMTQDKGISRGGSFLSPGYDVRVESTKKYNKQSKDIGFRVCIEIIEL